NKRLQYKDKIIKDQRNTNNSRTNHFLNFTRAATQPQPGIGPLPRTYVQLHRHKHLSNKVTTSDASLIKSIGECHNVSPFDGSITINQS
ncbi:hypothetical protein SAMD00019534_028980, partial [Acytostelium subglobosum LB1]|uniref:hypothetical protein n=1 Tax=Acytostelium subglobosum LB1 TaxID=1410327 RepID=UPI000644CAD4